MKASVSESIISVIVILVLILACLGVLSSVMWYKAAQREKILQLTVTANLVTIGIAFHGLPKGRPPIYFGRVTIKRQQRGFSRLMHSACYRNSVDRSR